MEEYVNCFSCGAKSLNFEGKCHEYMLASPGCYDMFNEVLEREYSDFIYAKAHHFTVDAYAAQHPGEWTNQKAVNSVGVHLISLFFIFEFGFELTKAANVKMEFARYNKINNVIHPLENPKLFDGYTIYEVWDNEKAEDHFELCKKWALNTWIAWNKHHNTIKEWANRFGRNKF